MPRRSSGGRSAARAPPRPAPMRNPPQPAHQSPPAPDLSGGGSLLGGIGSTIAQGMAFGTGSAVAHRAVDAVMGPRTIQHETVASQASKATAVPMGNTTSGMDSCNIHSKASQDDLLMEKKGGIGESTFFGNIWSFFRKLLFLVLTFGPMPNHIAFIMDGNRRFAKSKGIKQGGGHRIGFAALISTLQYCYEMGVKYVTVYAFSIDNFKRKPDEVHSVMSLMQEKIDELLKEESIVKKYGIQINFWGNLELLSEPVRLSVEKAMTSTAKNNGPVLSVCVAYTSTDEIMHAIKKSCAVKIANGFVDNIEELISVDDLEKHLYSADCPEPDIVIRTSGESRLSNFLLWQTAFTHLQNPIPLWPDFSLWHLVFAILQYQKVYPYLRELRNKGKKKA